MREGREILGLKKEEREYQILLFKFRIVLELYYSTIPKIFTIVPFYNPRC